MASNYLKQSRHGSVFYFRRRIPDDLRLTVGKPYIVKSLGTGMRREAIIRARVLAAYTDGFFAQLRTMPDDQNDTPLRIDFTYQCIEELGLKKHVIADIQPGEELAAATFAQALGLTSNAPTVSPVPKGNGKSITEAWEAYKAEKIVTKAWRDGEDTAKYDHWPHIRDFVDLIGDKPIGAVTAEDVERFQQHILTERPDESANNKNKRLTRAGALLRWAKSKRTWGVIDDFGSLFRFPGDIPKNPYLKFEPSDLAALFESDAYREQRFKAPSDYWLPVLALFTGARLNELCQLTAGDIGTHDEVQTISILDEEIGKRLKTSASRRIIPIHSKLIELGFLDYVSTTPSGRIFPELPEDPNRPGNYGAKASEDFTTYRRACGVGALEGRSNKAFHSFRSTLISALRRANVPKDRRTRLAGHEYEDTQDLHYTGGDVLTMFDFKTLRADIESVRYDVSFTPYLSRS
jgi:integrase